MTQTNGTSNQTIGEQLKGVRKGQRVLVDGVYLGGSATPGCRVTYKGRLNGFVVFEGRTSDPIYVDPARIGTVTR